MFMSLRYLKSQLLLQFKTLVPMVLHSSLITRKKINEEAHYSSLSDKWGITAFMDRKTPGGDGVMRYLSGGSNYPWKTMITLNITEIENHAEVGTKIAKGFTKFCLDEKHNCPEKFVFHEVYYADEPKSLNYYHMDKDCVAMLKRMYGGDDGSTKQDLTMEYGDLLTKLFRMCGEL
jgi:hypothetical protein